MESSDKKKIIFIVVVMVVLMVGMSVFLRTGFQDIRHEKIQPAKKQESSQTETKKMEDNREYKTLSVRIDDMTYTMSVDASKAGQEFARSTPFELEMVDLNGNEKYYEGKESLPASPEKPGHVEAGDVMLYGDKIIVIFYKSFDTTESYTRLGKIVSSGSLEQTLENNEKITAEFFKQEEL